MYVYGKNTCEEIIKKGEKIKKAFIMKNFSDKYLISALEKRNISIKYLSKFEIDKLANGNHQGIIFDIPDYEYCDDSEFVKVAKEYNLLLVPASSFGVKGYVRIAYCVSYDTIERSMTAFRKLAQRYGLIK